MSDRKKLKDTRIGKWLKEKAPHVLETVGDLLPDNGVLGVVKNLIDKDDKITPEDKQHALELLKLDMEAEKEITARWQSDMNSDSWMSKNARPMVLLAAVLMLFIFMFLDSLNINFEVKENWISLYEMMLITTIGAYFGMRSWEKIKKSN